MSSLLLNIHQDHPASFWAPSLSGSQPHSAILFGDSVSPTAMPAARSLSGPKLLCSSHLIFLPRATPDTVVTPPHLKIKPLSPQPEPAILSPSGNPTDGPAVCPSQDGLTAPHASATWPHFPEDPTTGHGPSHLAYTLNFLPPLLLLTSLVQPQPWSITTLHPHCTAPVAREGKKRKASSCLPLQFLVPSLQWPSSGHSPPLQVTTL